MQEITMGFDPGINGYVVSLPSLVKLRALEIWGLAFARELDGRSSGIALLFDTNTHNFESIDCLKWRKLFLTQNKAVRTSVCKVAFVQPANFRLPGVVSGSEAYFSNVNDACERLKIVS